MKHVLKLYITGQTPNSVRALENMNKICKEDLFGEFEIKVVDILKEPHLAEDDKIIATPTVIKVLPPPIRKVVGDLSEKEKVLLGLDLVPIKKK